MNLFSVITKNLEDSCTSQRVATMTVHHISLVKKQNEISILC